MDNLLMGHGRLLPGLRLCSRWSGLLILLSVLLNLVPYVLLRHQAGPRKISGPSKAHPDHRRRREAARLKLKVIRRHQQYALADDVRDLLPGLRGVQPCERAQLPGPSHFPQRVHH